MSIQSKPCETFRIRIKTFINCSQVLKYGIKRRVRHGNTSCWVDATPVPTPLPLKTVVEFLREIQRRRLSLTWGWPEVCPSLILLLYWTDGYDLSSSLCRYHCTCICMKTNEWEEAFFWPITGSDLCCDTSRRMRMIKGGNPRPGLRSKDLSLNTSAYKDKKSTLWVQHWGGGGRIKHLNK